VFIDRAFIHLRSVWKMKEEGLTGRRKQLLKMMYQRHLQKQKKSKNRKMHLKLRKQNHHSKTKIPTNQKKGSHQQRRACYPAIMQTCRSSQMNLLRQRPLGKGNYSLVIYGNCRVKACWPSNQLRLGFK